MRMSDDDRETYLEAREIFGQVEPLLHGHDCDAIMVALAHLFACWLHLDDPNALPKNAIRFNKIAITHYDAMLRLDEKEVRH
jgi:hypothetical protein